MRVITAGGGILFRIKTTGAEVLLIRRNGVWDLPKGKLEKGESIEQCAVREVAEETGSTLPALVGYLTTTFHEYELKGERVRKKTVWYSMIYTKDNDTLKPQRDEGITGLEWIPPEEALEMVGYENLKKVLRSFLAQIKSAPI